MPGYSGTLLVQKLGIKPGSSVLTLGAPKDYKSWLAPIPAKVKFVAKAPSGGADIVHLFVKLPNSTSNYPRRAKP